MPIPEEIFISPIVQDWTGMTIVVARDLFRCAWCQTEVERFASGYMDAAGWSNQWQPRVKDADGREFCSEMCALAHGEARG